MTRLHRYWRRYRLTPRKALLGILGFVLSTFLWGSWRSHYTILSVSLHSTPFLHHHQPPHPHPQSPLLLPPPVPTPRPNFALGRTVEGCSELLRPINSTRLKLLVSRALVSDSVDRLKALLKNCSALKSQHSYWRWSVTSQERDFPLAFGFKMHDAPDMLERLLRVVWRPHNVYVIHVDRATTNDTFCIVQDLASCFDNVFFTATRVDLAYASVLSLHADIECVKVALKSPTPWKYYINLSGHEFPLRTNLEIVQILSFLNGLNDVENYTPGKFFANLLNKVAVINGKGTYLSSELRTPFEHQNVTLRKGSAYFSATREFLQWVLGNPVCQDFLEWLKKTWAADEMFWATANYLPGAPGGGQVDVSHGEDTFLSRAMAWQWDKYRCQGEYVRRVCVFSSGDLKWLRSRPELIANKFDPTKDPLVLDCLERELEERVDRGYLEMKAAGGIGNGSGQPEAEAEIRKSKPFPFPSLSTLDWGYYKALPHVKGRSSSGSSGDLGNAGKTAG